MALRVETKGRQAGDYKAHIPRKELFKVHIPSERQLIVVRSLADTAGASIHNIIYADHEPGIPPDEKIRPMLNLDNLIDRILPYLTATISADMEDDSSMEITIRHVPDTTPVFLVSRAPEV